MKQPVISARTRRVIEAAVRANLGEQKLRSLAIRPDVDPFGKDALEIELQFAAADQPLPRGYRNAMALAISDALVAQDEERFPYVEFRFDEAPVVKDRERAS